MATRSALRRPAERPNGAPRPTGEPEAPGRLLEGRRILVTGVLTHHSLAFGAAALMQGLGAEIVLTGHGRARRLTERAARMLPEPPDVLELDVLEPTHFEGLAATLTDRWDAIDGILHSIAWMAPEVWRSDFFEASEERLEESIRTSVYSLKSLAGALHPLLQRSQHGASLVTLTVQLGRYSPWYGWMGVVKATLAALVGHMAVVLGPDGTRVNAIACGPVRTSAATGIPDFDELDRVIQERAPLGWDSRDTAVVAGPAAFLMSDLARLVTGDILHVDGGFHAAV
jgi:meromycolic acid enoyl-[acyl-carrier-protein] reductase